MTPVLNHLWQSTLFAGVVFGLSLVLRKNAARVRYWLWLAASLKFLIPFAVLVNVGSRVELPQARVVTPAVTVVTSQVSEPFTELRSASSRSDSFPYLLLGWACGSAVLLLMWSIKLRRLRTVLAAATPVKGMDLPIPVRASATRIEPGVIGLFRPVLVLPEGLRERLSSDQMRAIVAHEMCHVRYKDNLAFAFHMATEVLFWFHPAVWWIGARLITERERACDEEVLRLGNSPESYATSIVTVCKLYLQSPLPCAAGVTGADLKQRVMRIMSNGVAQCLGIPQKLLLAGCATAAVSIPMLTGVIHATAQSVSAAKYEVASIRPNVSGSENFGYQLSPNGGIRLNNHTAKQLVAFAYDVRDFQIEGGPSWLQSNRFDIAAKLESSRVAAASDNVVDYHRQGMQILLKERFSFQVQHVTGPKPGFVLRVAKGGHKLQPPTPVGGNSEGRAQMVGRDITLRSFATMLSSRLGRMVQDETGIEGRFDLKLTFPLDEEGSIFTSIQEQLGLKLESAKVPTAMIRIERIERPSEN